MMRRRKTYYLNEDKSFKYFDESEEKIHSQIFFGIFFWIFIIAFQIIFLLLTDYSSKQLPYMDNEFKQKHIDNHYWSWFSESKARVHLESMTSFGSRLVGSEANEVFVVEYLLNEINEIKNKMNFDKHGLEIDSRRLSGSFDIDFIGGFTSVYQHVNIIAVRISDTFRKIENTSIVNLTKKSALLINCHYDSITISPGGSDDAVSCSIMLEVLRVISISDKSLLNDIIFLFNGAEENILQASHGFITKHHWGRDIKAFINLEAAGAGGKEILFQSGSSWLLEQYAKNVPHPFASIIAQEIFQSGIIPADTDFRIFRDFGNLPGLDIAYIRNGYVYHTSFDKPSMIPPGCIQRGGENLLSLVTSIGDSADLDNAVLQTSNTKLVFFDIYGTFMLQYSIKTATFINLFAITLSIIKIFLSAKKFGRRFLVLLFACSISSMIVLIASIFAGILIGLFNDQTGNAMSWFTNVYFIIPLYSLPALIICMATTLIFRKFIFGNNHDDLYLEQICMHDAILLLYSFSLLILSLLKIGSAMAILPFVLFPAIVSHSRFYFSPSYIMVIFRILVSIPGLIIFNACIYESLLLIVPVTGRIGPDIKPDLIIAFIVSFHTVIIFSYWIPLIVITKSAHFLLKSLICFFVSSLFVVFFTHFGFPYGSDPIQPTMQKSVINHITRTFHDINGNEIDSDSGILYLPLDRNGHRTLLDYIDPSEIIDQPELSFQCLDRPYCGWPYYFPVLADMSSFAYVKRPGPVFTSKPILKLEFRNVFETVHNFSFSIQGPPHMCVYLLAGSSFKIKSWSIGSGVPHPTKMPSNVLAEHFFIYYSYAVTPEKPFVFNISLTGKGSPDKGVLHVALAAHYFLEHSTYRGNKSIKYGNYNKGIKFGNDLVFEYLNSSVMDEFIQQLPNWTSPLYWPSTYDSFIF